MSSTTPHLTGLGLGIDVITLAFGQDSRHELEQPVFPPCAFRTSAK
jgi:hypothetical protein